MYHMICGHTKGKLEAYLFLMVDLLVSTGINFVLSPTSGIEISVKLIYVVRLQLLGLLKS